MVGAIIIFDIHQFEHAVFEGVFLKLMAVCVLITYLNKLSKHLVGLGDIILEVLGHVFVEVTEFHVDVVARLGTGNHYHPLYR